jgi:outer membrane protein assembly factor BamE (lipoprotein component of BamABCDE complex)
MMSVILLLIFSIFQYSSGISIASAFTKITGNNAITFEQYQQVQFGWTRDQLTQYVGSPGKVIPSPDNNPNTILVQYQGPSTNIIAIAGFAFWNGILYTKTQTNFDFVTNYRITKEQYNIIQIGWTYQQVRATVGNQKGNVISESGVQGSTAMVVQYTGIKDGEQKVDGFVTLGFLNEKLLTKSQYGW